MDRDAGLRLLRLSKGAGPREIDYAYKSETRPLKLRLLGAQRPEEIALLRQSLMTLVQAREVVSGAPRTPVPRPGVSGRKVLRMLGEATIAGFGGDEARRFFGISAPSGRDEVLSRYRDFSRALVRRFASAADRDEITRIRRARAKLRTLRNFALGGPAG